MKIETYPLIVGAIVAFVGLLLLFDAWTPDETVVPRERRQAPRPERSRGGETALGFGVLCLAAAILGRDSWRYSIVAAIAGSVLVLLGAVMNRRYVRGRLVTYVDEPGAGARPEALPTERELPLEPSREGVDPGQPASGDTPRPTPEKRLRIR